MLKSDIEIWLASWSVCVCAFSRPMDCAYEPVLQPVTSVKIKSLKGNKSEGALEMKK